MVGLLLVNLFQPGARVSEDLLESNRIRYELRDANGIEVLDDINLLTEPRLESKVEEITGESVQMNDWVMDKLTKAERTKPSGPLHPLDVVPTNIFRALADMSMLQIIFFAVFFGVVLVGLPKETSALDPSSEALNEVFVQMVWIVMKAMPLFVFALMAGQIVNAAGSDPEMFRQLLEYLLQYSLVVVLGLAFMVFLFYPSLVSLLVRKLDYRKFMSGMRDAQITAFSTSSSVATLPVTMDCVRNRIGVSERTTSFVLPIGATVNMDGTALYQAVAVVSLAQFHMVDLSLAQQAVIVLTATLASRGRSRTQRRTGPDDHRSKASD